MKPHVTLPAEWAEQDAVLLTWPHSNTDWKPYLEEVNAVFLEIARAVLCDQALIISCEDTNMLEHCRAHLQTIAEQSGHALYLYNVPADDTWARDHGPITVFEKDQPVLLDFTFNAWGDKFASSKDNAITQNLFDIGAFPGAKLNTIDMILEGGSIESDGQGTLLTTSQCLLTATRNADLSRETISQQLCDTLGLQRVLWLEHGHLQGDDTDAHIDTLVRLCSPDTLCYVQCKDTSDEHYAALRKMEKELEALRTLAGNAYKLVPLPMCEAIIEQGERLPATYANFLIINHSVLLPVYNVPQDDEAIAIMRTLFPERRIVPINCRPLIRQHGSLHCVTMQLPKGVLA